MTRRKPAEQPHLAPLKIEGQPWHEDPDLMAAAAIIADAAARQDKEKEVMAKFSDLDATDPLPQPDPATATEAMIYHKNDVDRAQVDDLARRLALAGMTENVRSDLDSTYDPTFGIDADGFYAHPTPVKESDLLGNLYEDDSTANPYLLQSSKILGDLANEASRARRTIAQLDAEMAHLAQDADFQIARITARRDAELESRRARVDDLMKIVAANTIVNGEKQESGE